MKTKFTCQLWLCYGGNDYGVHCSGQIYEGSGAADDKDSLDDFKVIRVHDGVDITDLCYDDEIEELQQDFIDAYAKSKQNTST